MSFSSPLSPWAIYFISFIPYLSIHFYNMEYLYFWELKTWAKIKKNNYCSLRDYGHVTPTLSCDLKATPRETQASIFISFTLNVGNAWALSALFCGISDSTKLRGLLWPVLVWFLCVSVCWSWVFDRKVVTIMPDIDDNTDMLDRLRDSSDDSESGIWSQRKDAPFGRAEWWG